MHVWIGIDPGSATTGVAIIGAVEEKKPGRPRAGLKDWALVKSVSTSETNRVHRNSKMADNVLDAIERMLRPASHQAIACAIEEPFVGANARTALVQYGAYAVICDAVWRGLECGPLHSVNPSTLKKFVGAKTKEMVMRQAFRKFGFDGASHDVVDALILAMYAWSLGNQVKCAE